MDLSRVLGIRDRLRCPNEKCHAIGTWKPHGGWIDVAYGDVAGVRRWMCKFCGLTRYADGDKQVYPSESLGYWELQENLPDDRTWITPWHMVRDFMKTNPWSG
jgi:hypothetical protein